MRAVEKGKVSEGGLGLEQHGATRESFTQEESRCWGRWVHYVGIFLDGLQAGW